MTPLPHLYHVALSGGPTGYATLAAAGLATLRSAPPRYYDGPGDAWSPEHLLLASVETASCSHSERWPKLPNSNLCGWIWRERERSTEKDGVTRFTEIVLTAKLTLPPGGDLDRARRILDKCKTACLVTASLSTPLQTCCCGGLKRFA
jgi:hypothetical protein